MSALKFQAAPFGRLELSPSHGLEARSASINDAISSLFRVDVVARSRDDALDVDALVGEPLAIELEGAGKRTWRGVCASAAQTAIEAEGLSTYAIAIVPRLWLLSHRTAHRIFRGMSAPELALALLREWSIEPKVELADRSPALAAIVQYGESDLDLLRRVLAESGISFFHDEASNLVLSDAPHLADPGERSGIPFLSDTSLTPGVLSWASDVGIRTRVVPERVVLRDYDFRRPLLDLEASSGAKSLLEEYRYLPGASLVGGPGGDEPVADAEGAYRHREDALTARARRMAEAHAAHATTVSFRTSRGDLTPGAVFSLTGHPHPVTSNGKRLLVTHASLHAAADGSLAVSGDAVPADKPYRPHETGTPGTAKGCGDEATEHEATASHIAKAPARPLVSGVDHATVTGPSGVAIHTDEHGRVALQFPWDREDKGSAWARTSQAGVGSAHGVTVVPRVGHQVVVAYQHGAPEHPMVVGSVHTATSPVPYALPGNSTLTVIKTDSSSGGNELTFDDKAGAELIYELAAEDLHKIVKNDELEETDGTRQWSVTGDLVITVGGTVTFLSGRDLEVQGGPHVKVNPKGAPPPAKKPKPITHAPAKSSGLNAILSTMDTGTTFDGQSAATAHAYLNDAKRFQADAIKLGEQWHVPPAVILAIMCRESGFGTLLDADGWAPGGGFGIMQAQGISSPGGGDGWDTMEEGMSIFHGKQLAIAAEHPNWTPAQQLAGSIAAYNAGQGNIQTQPTNAATWAEMDQGTAAKYGTDNYSRDVWNMAQYYSTHLTW